MEEETTKMWRERAEAAEAEVCMLRGGSAVSRLAEAVEIYSTAVRLVALVEMYPDDAVCRALMMVRDAAHKDDGEDAAALLSIVRMIERRAWPEEWHGRLAADIEASEAARATE
jgi:hypothetical protein